MICLRQLTLRRCRRGAALYITVLSVALIVALIGLAGLQLARLERSSAGRSAELCTAAAHARSAVELAVARVNADSAWRANYTSGVETTPLPVGPLGTISWILEDTDGSLTNRDSNLRVRGIGRAGRCVQAARVGLAAVIQQTGPQELRSMTSTASQATDEVGRPKQWCQYLKPTLPAGTVEWAISRVEIYCAEKDDDKRFSVRLFQPQTNNWPSSTLLDERTTSAAAVGNTWRWYSVALNSVPLDPANGICVAVMTEGGRPIFLAYRNGGVTEANSALIRGGLDKNDNVNWQSYETDKALLYRVHGTYKQATGQVSVLSGTWQRTAAP